MRIIILFMNFDELKINVAISALMCAQEHYCVISSVSIITHNTRHYR